MSNLKSATSMSKITALAILLPISFVLLHIALTITNVLNASVLNFFIPLLANDLAGIDLEPIIEMFFLSLIGDGIIMTIRIFITWLIPITILIAIVNFLIHKLNLETWLARWWISQTQGFIGRLLTFLRIASFDGNLILEDQLEVEQVSITSFGELVKSIRTYSKGVLIVPTGIVGLIWAFFGGSLLFASPSFILWEVFLDLILYVAVLLIPVIFVVVFFPAVTILRQSGLRIVKTDSNNEVVRVSNLGDNIFSIVGNIFGIGALFLITGIWAGLIVYKNPNLPDLMVLLFNAILSYPIGLLFAFTYLFVLIILFLPASALFLLDLFPERIITAVKQTRVQILQEGIAPFGDVDLKVEGAD
ncbi:MAG: hypothetical protein ACFFCZ_04725 [Promethearchaeota archaeon]